MVDAQEAFRLARYRCVERDEVTIPDVATRTIPVNEVDQALADPGVKSKLAEMALDPMPLKPEEVDAVVKAEVANFMKIADAAGIGKE